MRHRLTIAVMALGVIGALGGTAQADAPGTPSAASTPITMVVRADVQRSILSEALDITGLSGLFDACNDAHTTVFAPSDSAFRATFAAMGLTESEALADTGLLGDLITAHVVSGEVDGAALADGRQLTALNGSAITVGDTGTAVSLNRAARVTKADVAACNGVMHLIDRTLVVSSAQRSPMPTTGLVHQRLVVGASAAILLAGAAAMLVARRPRRQRI
jgi:transforming growth factor-beta-induced protein